MKILITFFCCLAISCAAFAENLAGPPKGNRISTDNRVSKFGRYADEYFLSAGLLGGMNLGDDMGMTNPYFIGANVEFERIFNRKWSLGVKLNPRVNLSTSETMTYKIPAPIPSMPSYQYTQEFDYNTYYAIPVFVGGKYYFRPFFVRPYVGLDVGASILIGNIDGAQFLNTSSEPFEISMVFAVTPRFGIIFDITEKLHWGFNLYCNVFTGSLVNGESITAIGMSTEEGVLLPQAQWTSFSKRLSPGLSVGAEVSVVFSL